MKACECSRCGYEWDSRTDNIPKTCPKCKSYKWQELNDEEVKNVREKTKTA